MLRANGGQSGDAPFSGELLAIYSPNENPSAANLTPLTTIITRLAASNSDGLTVDNRNAAIASLTAIGAITDSEWAAVRPDSVNLDALDKLIRTLGFEGALNRLLADLSDYDVSAANMQIFPFAHGGVLYVRLTDTRDISAFPGATARERLDYKSLNTNALYSLELVSGPEWLELGPQGAISAAVPETAARGVSVSFQIAVTNTASGYGRTLSAAVFVIDSTGVSEVVAQEAQIILSPSKSFMVEVPDNAVTNASTILVQEGLSAGGGATIRVTAEPPLQQPYKIHLPAPDSLTVGRSVVANPLRSRAAEVQINSGSGCATDLNPDDLDPLTEVSVLWQATCVYYLDTSAPLTTHDFGWARMASRQKVVEGFSESTIEKRETSWLLSTSPQNFPSTGTPVLFVHGYQIDARGVAGGEDTWGNFPFLFAQKGYLPFEFRWQTNARFEDVADDLINAILVINDATGQPVHIVAHSFGGIVVRTLLQRLNGLAEAREDDKGFGSRALTRRVGNVDVAHLIASVTTLGTPHSGIYNELTVPNQFSSVEIGFPDGRDFDIGPLDLLGGCRQVSCFEMGVNIEASNQILRNLGLVSGYSRVRGPLPSQFGDLAVRLGAHEIPYRLPAEPPINVLIGLTKDDGNNDLIDNGDALISFAGQRFAPDLSVTRPPEPPGQPFQDTIEPFLDRSRQYGPIITESVLRWGKVFPRDTVTDPHQGYDHTAILLRGEQSEAEVPREAPCDVADSCTHAGWTQTEDFVTNAPQRAPASVDVVSAHVTVLDSNDNGLSGVSIHAYVNDIPIAVLGIGETDANGVASFSLPFSAYGRYSFVASPPDGIGYISTASVQSIWVVETPPPNGLVFDPVVLSGVQNTGDLSVSVADAETGLPVSDAQIKVFRTDRQRIELGEAVTQNGSAAFQEIPTGQVHILAKRNGYIASSESDCIVRSGNTNSCSIALTPIRRPWQRIVGTLNGRVEMQGADFLLPDFVTDGDSVEISFSYHTGDAVGFPDRIELFDPNERYQEAITYAIPSSEGRNEATISIAGNTWTLGSEMRVTLLNQDKDIDLFQLRLLSFNGPGDETDEREILLSIDNEGKNLLTTSQLPTSLADLDVSVCNCGYGMTIAPGDSASMQASFSRGGIEGGGIWFIMITLDLASFELGPAI